MRPSFSARVYPVMKRLVLAFGTLGLVGCFLPLIAGMSWFDMRQFDEGWSVWLVILAFAVPTYVGATMKDGDRAEAIAATASFGYLAYKFNTGVFDLVFHASIGGIMMGIALIGGLASALLAMGVANKRRS